MPIKNWPKISIIILNRNGKDFVLNCLTSVFRTDYPTFEIILVDNGSTDESFETVQKNFGQKKNLKIIKNIKNKGFAGGNNQGAKKATGSWLMFLNNDTIVDKNWLKNLMIEVLKNKKIAAAGCKQRSLIKKQYLDAVGGYVDKFLWSLKEGFQKKDKGQYDQVEEIFYGQGSSLLVKNDIFKKIKGFDSDYIIYYEEVDLCWRIWLAGHKIIFVPNAIVYHFGGGWQKTQPSGSFFYLLRRNHITNILKNYSVNKIIWILPIVLLFYLASIFVFLLKGEFSRAWAYLRAIGYNIIKLPKILNKRKFVQGKIRKIPDKSLNNLFVKKILFFSQLAVKN